MKSWVSTDQFMTGMVVEACVKKVSGKVNAPSSKSAVQRYLAGALLARGRSEITSGSLCADSIASLSVIRALGARAAEDEGRLIIDGGFNPVDSVVNCGESGLSSRMFIPVAALADREITVSGEGSLLKRPFGMIEKPLEQLNVGVKTNNGFLPVRVKGPLKGGVANADGSLSSQFITGLLMALPLAGENSSVFTANLVSRPYIDLTVRIASEFGVEIVNENYSVFHIRGGQEYKPGQYKAEGDWSGAAFLLVLGAIGGSAEVSGLDPVSVQADRAVTEALEMAGAKVSYGPGIIIVTKNELKCFNFDITNCPDIAPPLAVLATACKGQTVLRGARRLLAKESNRAESISRSLNAIGANISYSEDMLIIDGVEKLSGGESSAWNDHRIAMALATASVISSSPVTIKGYECINKSYPDFSADFTKLGGRIVTL